jgi:proline iminopeptidase
VYANIRGTRIYFDVEGAGLVPDGAEMREKPVLFVVPGGPGGDHSGFKPGYSPLAEKAQLVYFDHRGSGRSAAAPPDTYTMDNHVEDIEALRRHLGLDRIGLLGISYGGMVSLSYATRYQQHLSHLILVVTAPDHRFMKRAQEVVAERGTPKQQEVAARLFAGEFDSADQMREYFETMGPLYSRHFDLARERSRRPIFSPEAINAAYGRDLHGYDVTGQLAGIRVPTQVIGARHDWICAPEFSVEIAERIPGAQLRMFENSGHNVADDEHDAFIDVVRGFLDYPPRQPLEEERTTA